MKIIASQMYLRLSPSKIRPVVAMIKKLSPVKAVASLPLVNKRGAEPLMKVIKSAIAPSSTSLGIFTQ